MSGFPAVTMCPGTGESEFGHLQVVYITNEMRHQASLSKAFNEVTIYSFAQLVKSGIEMRDHIRRAGLVWMDLPRLGEHFNIVEIVSGCHM